MSSSFVNSCALAQYVFHSHACSLLGFKFCISLSFKTWFALLSIHVETRTATKGILWVVSKRVLGTRKVVIVVIAGTRVHSIASLVVHEVVNARRTIYTWLRSTDLVSKLFVITSYTCICIDSARLHGVVQRLQWFLNYWISVHDGLLLVVHLVRCFRGSHRRFVFTWLHCLGTVSIVLRRPGH